MIGFNALVPLLSLVTLTQTPPPAQGGSPAEVPARALFGSNEMITLEITGPIDALGDDRDEEPEYPATIRWSLGTDEGELPVQIKARGNFRKQRSTCSAMPPVRLNFVKEDVVGTLFQGQDKIKLVTHCRDDDDYEQNVLEEYLAYRIYNQLTEQSFQARLALITYVDTEENESIVRHGFLIEDEEVMAARLGGVVETFEQIHPHRFVEGTEPRVALFEYMIGNTDFSTVAGHNLVIVSIEGTGLVPVPYDFDWSGMVGAGYARPAEQLPIRHVRQRLYRGFCRPGQDITSHLPAFRDLQAGLPALFEELEGWKEDARENTEEYLQEFFEILDDSGKVERDIVEKCRNVLS